MELKQTNLNLRGLTRIARNLSVSELYEEAIRAGEGTVVQGGAFATLTGKYTGRSAKDKFVVCDETTENEIWWEGGANRMERGDFDRLRARQQAFLQGRSVFVLDCYAGWDPKHRIRVRVITQHAWHNLFARNMFVEIPAAELPSLEDFEPEFTVIHTPDFQALPELDRTKSEVFVALDFTQRVVAIGGTSYAGEIKKSIFTVLNYYLPKQGVMGMHCSANTGPEGGSALFFGLSGTGKTTLSADASRGLIGDDEHGWGDEGVFNFEGGCYAKVIKLAAEAEPEIYATTHTFGTVLENVVVREDRSLDLDDDRYTENTRASYPLSQIPNVVAGGCAGHPKNVIFLTCDAFGVLPPIAKLTPAQAMYHFVCGYTAKVAGTERGVTEPQATFSSCFGAPFMPLHPGVYAQLLGEKIAAHGASCWLVNTGWSGGPYGTGKRMPIRYSRAIIHAALEGALEGIETTLDPVFGFGIPVSVPGVPSEILTPKNTWPDQNSYEEKADRLAEMFNKKFESFAAGMSAEVIAAAPQAQAARR